MSEVRIATFPEVVDSTMLVAYGGCPQRFFNEYCLHLVTIAISPDLHAGGAFARGLEVTRRAFWFKHLPATDAIVLGVDAIMEFWGDYEPPDKMGRPHPKDFVNTIDAFLDYFREYPLETDPIKPYIMTGDRPAIEFTFAQPLPISHPTTGDPILYGGRLDLLGYYNNLVAVIDEKTATSLGTSWASVMKMRGQFIGYTWAAQQHDIPAETCVIRGVAIQKTKTSHLQHIIQFPRWRIEHWHNNMLERVARMVTDFKDGYWEYAYGDACSNYGGCAYMDLCTSEHPEAWYDSYKTRVWNPLWRNPTDPSSDAKTAA